MDWQVKLLFFAILFLLPGFVHADSEKACGKAWVPAPIGTSVQNGKLREIKESENGQSDKVQIKDFRGNLIKETSLPREIGYLRRVDSAGDSLVYSSKGKIYHFDPEKNREQEIVLKTNGASICDRGDKTSIMVSCGSDSSEDRFAYDFKSQKQLEISDAKHAQVRGQIVAYPEDSGGADSFSKISLYDFASSKKVSFEIPRSKNMQFSSENHIKMSQDGGNGHLSTHIVRVDGRWTKFTDTKNRSLSGVLTNGDLMFVNMKNKSGKDVEISEANFNDFEITTEIYDKTGTQKKTSVDGYYTADFFGGKGVLKMEVPSKMKAFSESSFRDIAAGKDVKPQIVSDIYIPISESGKWGLEINSAKDKTHLTNLNTGKSFKLPYMSSGSIQEAQSGSNVAVIGHDAGTYVIDTESGKIRSFESNGYNQFDKNFTNWFQYRDGLETVKEVCLPDGIKVIDDDCGCLFRNADNGAFSQDQNFKNIKDIALLTMCQRDPFNTQEWDKIAPPITKGEISKSQAQIYLKRFQKIQGFDSKIHLGILTGILKSDIVEQSPALVNETLKSIAAAQPNLIRQIYNVMKIDKRMPHYAPDDTLACRSSFDQKYLEARMQNLKNKTANSDSKTTIEDWLAYKPFKSEFQKLPKEQRDAIVDSIAESLSQNAAVSSDLNGIFQSKLYYFAKKFALDLVGDKSKSATDLAVAARNGKNIPIILGSGDLQDASRSTMEDSTGAASTFGFSYKALDPIAVPEGAKVGETLLKKVNWSYEGAPFSADAKITVLEPLGNLIAKDKSPNYSALKKDGKLTGMMVIGSNLSSGHARLVDEYLTYYQNAGFEFKEAKPVDAVSFFKTSVQSGELDYLIKEAHSDGDEKNLFRANKYGKLYEGTMTKKDGSKEVVYLLSPDSTKTDAKLISNQEFGSWIRSRGKDQPLVYFNASCSSTRKVISEVAATHSSNFIPIPSASSVLTFSDTEGNGTRQMLQAFRDGKSYDNIRTALQKSANYQKGEDRFIFPDEKDYDEKIRKNLRMNLDIEVSVKDKSGNEVHIDENIDH